MIRMATLGSSKIMISFKRLRDSYKILLTLIIRYSSMSILGNINENVMNMFSVILVAACF